MSSNFPSENPNLLPTFIAISIPPRDPSQSPRNNPSMLPYAVPLVYNSGDSSSVPIYVPSVNPSRDSSEQQLGDIQE